MLFSIVTINSCFQGRAPARINRLINIKTSTYVQVCTQQQKLRFLQFFAILGQSAEIAEIAVFAGHQPRPQGFSLKKWVGREKALASAGHVSPRTP